MKLRDGRRVVLDTCVILKFYLNEKGAEDANRIFSLVENGGIDAYIPVLTTSELIVILSRKSGIETIWKCLGYLFEHFHVISVTLDIAIPAGFLKTKYASSKKRFFYIDGIIVSTAQILDATVVTYDSEFDRIEEIAVMKPEEFLKKISVNKKK